MPMGDFNILFSTFQICSYKWQKLFSANHCDTYRFALKAWLDFKLLVFFFQNTQRIPPNDRFFVVKSCENWRGYYEIYNLPMWGFCGLTHSYIQCRESKYRHSSISIWTITAYQYWRVFVCGTSVGHRQYIVVKKLTAEIKLDKQYHTFLNTQRWNWDADKTFTH